MKEFAERILQTLKTNGFPQKKVSLPTDKMFEVAESKGLSFNDVLKVLKDEHNVESQIGAEKIIFSQAVTIQNTDTGNPFAGMDPQAMMKQAQEMMSKMSPEELKKIQEMFENMTPEQKDEMLRKGKDLGIL